MRRTCRVLVMGVLLSSFSASGHLCNNIYRTPDRLIVKPEKQVTAVDGADEFRVFVQNNYHTYVHNVRLSAQVEGGDGVTVSISPQAAGEMKAGERVSFDVKIAVAPGTPRGQRRLRFGISANEVGLQPVAEPSIEALRRASEDGNHSPAIMAAESLMKLKDPQGAEKLCAWARREDPDYRGRSIRAIGKSGAREQIPFLRELLAERNGWIQGNALLALGLLKDDVATFVPYRDNRDDFIKACAVAGMSLAGGNGNQLVEQLKAGLASDNVYVRIAVGWALAARRDKNGVAALDAAFKTDDPRQRTTAGDALVDVANRPTAGAE